MVKLPDHGHCENCGDTVAFGEQFCSDDCRDKYKSEMQEAKSRDTRFYIIMGAAIAVAAMAAYAVKVLI